MAGQETRSAARVRLIAITDKVPTGVSLGICENFSIQRPLPSTSEKGIGSVEPDAISQHGADALQVSWEVIPTFEQRYTELGIIPERRELANVRPFSLTVVALREGSLIGETLYTLVDCYVQSVSESQAVNQSGRMSISAIARSIVYGTES